MMVERRDQVLITFLEVVPPSTSTLRRRLSSMYGPFLIDLATAVSSIYKGLFLLPPHDEAVGPFVDTGLVTLGRHTPRRDRMPATGALALATAMRMVDRVHRHTTGLRTLAKPAITTGFADLDILMISIADLPDGGTALLQHQANLAGWHPQLRVLAFLGSNHGVGAGAAGQLPPLANLE